MSLSIMPPRRRITTTVPPPKKRRRVESKVEEITFDLREREDYLSGFHKRKVQRQKQAQAEAVKRAHQEKLTARKILREGRKADLEKHVEAINAVLKNDRGLESEESGDDEAHSEVEGDVENESLPVDHEEEYVDEDKFTTVTVEAVEVSRDGLQKVRDGTEVQTEDDKTGDTVAGRSSTGKQVSKEERMKHAKNKPRKKQFKYESKADRKITRFKEHGKGKRQAKERREK